jgi:RNase P subunit RPR2
MRCPRCKNKLLQKSGTRIRVRTKGPLVFTEDGSCSAQCYWCGEPVAVPLALRESVAVDGDRVLFGLCDG